MKLPTKRQSKGYDCIVWIDEDGDVVCQAYTEKGTKFLQQMDKRYNLGDVLEIITHPEEFKKHIPPMLKVGAIAHGSQKVSLMNSQGLQ